MPYSYYFLIFLILVIIVINTIQLLYNILMNRVNYYELYNSFFFLFLAKI